MMIIIDKTRPPGSVLGDTVDRTYSVECISARSERTYKLEVGSGMFRIMEGQNVLHVQDFHRRKTIGDALDIAIMAVTIIDTMTVKAALDLESYHKRTRLIKIIKSFINEL